MNSVSVPRSTHESRTKSTNNQIADLRIRTELRRMWQAGIGFTSTSDRDRFIDLFRKGVAA